MQNVRIRRREQLDLRRVGDRDVVGAGETRLDGDRLVARPEHGVVLKLAEKGNVKRCTAFAGRVGSSGTAGPADGNVSFTEGEVTVGTTDPISV